MPRWHSGGQPFAHQGLRGENCRDIAKACAELNTVFGMVTTNPACLLSRCAARVSRPRATKLERISDTKHNRHAPNSSCSLVHRHPFAIWPIKVEGMGGGP